MRKILVLLAGFLLLIGLSFTTGSARAGGWATLTLSELPSEVVAERPFIIEFLLLQHGQTPMSGADVFTEVRATHVASGQQVAVAAESTDRPGYYAATVHLPTAGEWQWEIEAFTAVYPMPPLMVNDAVAVADVAGAGTAVPWQLALGWTTAVGAMALFYFWSRQRNRLRLAGGLLLGGLSLFAFALHTQLPQPVLAESEKVVLPAIAPEALGEALFVAKGCIQCHSNENVTMAQNLFQIGPDLTFVKRPPEYVALWLANPADLKADTMMPNLHLSEAEISMLVDFLYQD